MYAWDYFAFSKETTQIFGNKEVIESGLDFQGGVTPGEAAQIWILKTPRVH